MADIFDKIIAGEIPSYKVYEDDDLLAFLDISQVTPGHTLLIPKKHVDDIFAYDDDIAQKVLLKLPVLARAIKTADKTITGINISSNNGPSAGQTVIHSHWHLIPRRDGDCLNDALAPTIDNSDQYDESRYEEIAQNIKKELE
ncbi:MULTISPECIES: HIT family protein [Fructobacillus]|jgi:histidine triad (HIT) family protein|uniref:Histidine triade (HIT) family (HinT) n=1 Tax=Fructobacillus cardui TaxID=2893170 RepID=A0ABN9YRA9_9LACO|nr:HIT family protein [Fructobacillus sp. EFB-N1]KMK53182.1 HIT-like protein [Fructobacillus sp. EFB-N1]CAK1227415.1 Purine nucleoside phosphoramidase/Ap4A hydrolase [Fructobacillus cardui]CAK1232776.1 Purine nucleoside phosphoramidase/Ap4A hydrolase [Fructobacillus cardui]CAK1236830.1 Purine nucleoside phosphoramidase/Ap4A hydrolase [Fructobacillus cardui]